MKQLTIAALASLALAGCGSTIAQHAKAAVFLNDVSEIAHEEITEKLAREVAACSARTGASVVDEGCMDAAMDGGAAVIEAASLFDRAVASYATGALAAQQEGAVDQKAPPLLKKALELYAALRSGLKAWADAEIPEVPPFVATLIGGAQ